MDLPVGSTGTRRTPQQLRPPLRAHGAIGEGSSIQLVPVGLRGSSGPSCGIHAVSPGAEPHHPHGHSPREGSSPPGVAKPPGGISSRPQAIGLVIRIAHAAQQAIHSSRSQAGIRCRLAQGSKRTTAQGSVVAPGHRPPWIWAQAQGPRRGQRPHERPAWSAATSVVRAIPTQSKEHRTSQGTAPQHSSFSTL